MKGKTYLLAGVIGLLFISAIPKNAGLVQGYSPGERVPKTVLEEKSNFNFQNHSGRYTLLNFWAAYDAESRASNIQLSNEVRKLSPEKISFCSISFDESEFIFSETVRIDKLIESTQYQANLSERKELSAKFNLKKGFANFLINDQGVIVAINVNPEELANLPGVV